MFVLCDLWSGIRKSKKSGKYVHSFGLRRTVEKLVKYFNFYIAFLFFDIVQMSLLYSLNEEEMTNLWVFPFVSILGTLFIGITEIKSIFEKIDKKERTEIKESIIFASKIIEVLKNKEVKEILSQFQQNTVNDEQCNTNGNDEFIEK